MTDSLEAAGTAGAAERAAVVARQREVAAMLSQARTGPASLVCLPAQSAWKVESEESGAGDRPGPPVQVSQYSAWRGHLHHNYRGTDPLAGLVVVSVKSNHVEEKNVTDVIVRTAKDSYQDCFEEESCDADSQLGPESVVNIVKLVCPELTLEKLELITCPQTEDIIAEYDAINNDLIMRNKFSFGVLYQKEGQTSEFDIFSNLGHCDKFDRFLSLLGVYVPNSGDSSVGSYHRQFHDNSLKFWVSTKLQHSSTDTQQCFRKAKIGNCVCCVVFQVGDAVFSPEIVTSQFLHCYIVIRPVGVDQYRVQVVTKAGVPPFPPVLSQELSITEETVGQIFTKLIHAEQASYKTGKLAVLRENYRLSELAQLQRRLQQSEDKKPEAEERWKYCSVL